MKFEARKLNIKRSIKFRSTWKVKGELKMLDEKDLKALQAMMESAVDTRVGKTEKLIEGRNSQTENLLHEEISRTQNILEKKMEIVQKNLDELSQYHRITKLENEDTALLLQMINDLKKEVEELKQKTA